MVISPDTELLFQALIVRGAGDGKMAEKVEKFRLSRATIENHIE